MLKPLILTIAMTVSATAMAQMNEAVIAPEQGCNWTVPYGIPAAPGQRETVVKVKIANAHRYADPAVLRPLLDRAEAAATAQCPANSLVMVYVQKDGGGLAAQAWHTRAASTWVFVENNLQRIAQQEIQATAQPQQAITQLQPTNPPPQPAVPLQPPTQPRPAVPPPPQAAPPPQVPTAFGVPIGLIFTLFILVAAPILWFCRHAIARAMRDNAATSSVTRVSALNESQWGETNRQNEEQRAAQLQALRDAVPHTPPQRMRATVHYNTFKIPVFETRYFEGLSAHEQTGLDTRYAVDMILELSEEERGIVVQHDLHTIVLDDKPLYSKDDLAKIRRAEVERAESMGGRSELDLLAKEITKQSADVVAAIAEVHREQTLVGDFLVAPFTKTFDHAHDAKKYGDEMTTKILPGIRKLIDSYRGHSDRPATMEF